MSLPWEDLWAAREAGDAAAEDDARDRLALLGAMLLGAAAERCGRATRDAIDRAGVTPAVWRAIEDAVEPMGEPLQRIYGWLSLEVKRLRAENWELAKTIARLELRVEALECETAEGTNDARGDAQRTDDDAGQGRGEGRAVAAG